MDITARLTIANLAVLTIILTLAVAVLIVDVQRLKRITSPTPILKFRRRNPDTETPPDPMDPAALETLEGA